MTLIDFVSPNLQTPKTWLDKYLKILVPEDTFRSSMVNGP